MDIIKTENINKLLTKEDYYHVHKILGIVCIINFIYRYASFFTVGSMNLNGAKDIFLIVIHCLLSWSSLIFHISNRRHRLLPIIYPEFRMHSIIFATRSIICVILHYYKMPLYTKIITCLLTNIHADIISYYYNSIGEPTTTMRNMPFDKDIDIKYQKAITRMHSTSQIAATLFMLPTIESAFSPLFAIQLAAFLMTLVKKNIITTNTWHIAYSFTLWINVITIANMRISETLGILVGYYLFYYLRFEYKKNKYLSWIIAFYAYYLLQEYFNNRIMLENFIFRIFKEENNMLNNKNSYINNAIIIYITQNMYCYINPLLHNLLLIKTT